MITPPLVIVRDEEAGRITSLVSETSEFAVKLAPLGDSPGFIPYGAFGMPIPHSRFSFGVSLTPDLLSHYGLSLNNAADLTLLASPVNSATAAARGFNKIPYSGFPATATVDTCE